MPCCSVLLHDGAPSAVIHDLCAPQDGDYLDGATRTLDVKLISYSPSTQLLGVAAASFQWDPSGSVHSPRTYSALPAGSRARCVLTGLGPRVAASGSQMHVLTSCPAGGAHHVLHPS